MRQVAENIWEFAYPLSFLGIQGGRRATVLRLANGRLVVHSTAAFTPDDITAIRALGEPAWLLEATKAHDSFAAAGRVAFPDIPYLCQWVFRRLTAYARHRWSMRLRMGRRTRDAKNRRDALGAGARFFSQSFAHFDRGGSALQFRGISGFDAIRGPPSHAPARTDGDEPGVSDDDSRSPRVPAFTWGTSCNGTSIASSLGTARLLKRMARRSCATCCRRRDWGTF